MAVEERLAEFRARKLAENAAKKPKTADLGEKQNEGTQSNAGGDPQQTHKTESDTTTNPHIKTRGCIDWLLESAFGRWMTSREFLLPNLLLLKVLLWLVLLGLFVELEFGLPFFVISLFYWLYEGLGSSASRQPGELSAYSVFNPDCQPLLGSLTAEQLEGEMGYRPLPNK